MQAYIFFLNKRENQLFENVQSTMESIESNIIIKVNLTNMLVALTLSERMPTVPPRECLSDGTWRVR